MKYRIQYVEDKGWFVTYGPRRPVASRHWFPGPLSQTDALALKRKLVETMRLRSLG